MRFAYSPNKLNEWNIRLSRPIFDQGKANSKSLDRPGKNPSHATVFFWKLQVVFAEVNKFARQVLKLWCAQNFF